MFTPRLFDNPSASTEMPLKADAPVCIHSKSMTGSVSAVAQHPDEGRFQLPSPQNRSMIEGEKQMTSITTPFLVDSLNWRYALDKVSFPCES